MATKHPEVQKEIDKLFEERVRTALEKKIMLTGKNAQDAQKRKEWFKKHVIITKA